jgi:YVTN family beta-propeller protein
MPDICKAIVVAVFTGAVFPSSTCGLFNKAPSIPVISGPSAGVVGVPVEFTATATDSEGDSVAFQFAWGDGDTSDWTSLVASGDTVADSHVYGDTGTYRVSVRAEDHHKARSDWSTSQAISIAPASRGYPDTILAELSVERNAFRCTVTPDGERLYVSHADEDFVTCIRLQDRAVLGAFEAGGDPGDLAASPDGQFLYVACSRDSVVAVIRISDHGVARKIHVGNNLQGLAVSPDGGAAYVTCSMTASLYVIRTPDNVLVDSVRFSGSPLGVAVSPCGQYVYVSTAAPDRVVVLSTSGHQVVAEIPTRRLPSEIAVTQDGKYVYVATQGDTGLAVIDTGADSVVGSIRLGGIHTNDIGSSPDGRYVFATDYFGLRYVDTFGHSLVDSLHYAGGWGYLAVHPSGDTIYVAGGSRVYVVGRK